MKDGFKIADVDTHLMEPDYIFERYIDEHTSPQRRKWYRARVRAPHFLVEGDLHPRKRQIPDGGTRLPRRRPQGDERFERAAKLGFSPESRS